MEKPTKDKYITCTNALKTSYLTIDKKYLVIQENEYYYKIRCDDNKERTFIKGRFND